MAMLAAATLVGIAGPTWAAPVKIGVSLPLSGTAALLANQFLDGARFAVDRLAGTREIELVAVDDGCDRDLGELAGEDMEAAGVVMVTGLLCNVAARAVAAEMSQEQIPILIAGARSQRLLEDREDEKWNIWRMSPGDSDAARTAFSILSKRWAGVPWALIDDGTIYGRTLSEELRAMMEEAGMTPQLVDTIRTGQSTQAALIRRLRNAAVGAVFIAASAEDTAIVWKNAREADLKLEIVGGEALSILPWVHNDADIDDGLFAVMEPPPLQLEPVKALLEPLKEADIEPEPWVFTGYAAMQVALASLSETPAQTSEALANGTFDTILGQVKFDKDGRNIVSRYALYRWDNNKFVLVDEEAAE